MLSWSNSLGTNLTHFLRFHLWMLGVPSSSACSGGSWGSVYCVLLSQTPGIEGDSPPRGLLHLFSEDMDSGCVSCWFYARRICRGLHRVQPLTCRRKFILLPPARRGGRVHIWILSIRSGVYHAFPMQLVLILCVPLTDPVQGTQVHWKVGGVRLASIGHQQLLCWKTFPGLWVWDKLDFKVHCLVPQWNIRLPQA